MKKSILTLAAITLLSVSLCTPNNVQAKAKYRTSFATVVNVTHHREEVTLETPDGNLWLLADVTGYKVNQKYTIIFDTLNTKSIYDDVIVKTTRIKVKHN